MKAFLMHRDRDFDLKRASPPNEAVLAQDLELNTLLLSMAIKDQLVFDVARKALLTGVSNDLETIAYRQHALRDALANPSTIRALYALAGEAIERERKVWGVFREYATGRLDNSVSKMQIFVDALRRVRELADRDSPRFKSEAFTTLFTMLARELSDDYFALIDKHLKRLRFRRGVLVSARLGKGLRGADYVLRKRLPPAGNWLRRIFGERPVSYRLSLAPRDEAGARAMGELRDRGLALAASALGKSAEHILSFFRMLQTELAFYIGCLNLHARLVELKAPLSFPSATALGHARFSSADLYDVCLALSMNDRPVGNDIAADGKNSDHRDGRQSGWQDHFSQERRARATDDAIGHVRAGGQSADGYRRRSVHALQA